MVCLAIVRACSRPQSTNHTAWCSSRYRDLAAWKSREWERGTVLRLSCRSLRSCGTYSRLIGWLHVTVMIHWSSE
jgi:hypothetical protein